MSNDDNRTTVKRAVRRALNEAVTNRVIDPEEALSILMVVATTYVAQVEDDAVRAEYIAIITESFGPMVEVARGADMDTLAMDKMMMGLKQ